MHMHTLNIYLRFTGQYFGGEFMIEAKRREGCVAISDLIPDEEYEEDDRTIFILRSEVGW